MGAQEVMSRAFRGKAPKGVDLRDISRHFFRTYANENPLDMFTRFNLAGMDYKGQLSSGYGQAGWAGKLGFDVDFGTLLLPGILHVPVGANLRIEGTDHNLLVLTRLPSKVTDQEPKSLTKLIVKSRDEEGKLAAAFRVESEGKVKRITRPLSLLVLSGKTREHKGSFSVQADIGFGDPFATDELGIGVGIRAGAEISAKQTLLEDHRGRAFRPLAQSDLVHKAVDDLLLTDIKEHLARWIRVESESGWAPDVVRQLFDSTTTGWAGLQHDFPIDAPVPQGFKKLFHTLKTIRRPSTEKLKAELDAALADFTKEWEEATAAVNFLKWLVEEVMDPGQGELQPDQFLTAGRPELRNATRSTRLEWGREALVFDAVEQFLFAPRPPGEKRNEVTNENAHRRVEAQIRVVDDRISTTTDKKHKDSLQAIRNALDNTLSSLRIDSKIKGAASASQVLDTQRPAFHVAVKDDDWAFDTDGDMRYAIDLLLSGHQPSKDQIATRAKKATEFLDRFRKELANTHELRKSYAGRFETTLTARKRAKKDGVPASSEYAPEDGDVWLTSPSFLQLATFTHKLDGGVAAKIELLPKVGAHATLGAEHVGRHSEFRFQAGGAVAPLSTPKDGVLMRGGRKRGIVLTQDTTLDYKRFDWVVDTAARLGPKHDEHEPKLSYGTVTYRTVSAYWFSDGTPKSSNRSSVDAYPGGSGVSFGMSVDANKIGTYAAHCRADSTNPTLSSEYEQLETMLCEQLRTTRPRLRKFFAFYPFPESLEKQDPAQSDYDFAHPVVVESGIGFAERVTLSLKTPPPGVTTMIRQPEWLFDEKNEAVSDLLTGPVPVDGHTRQVLRVRYPIANKEDKTRSLFSLGWTLVTGSSSAVRQSGRALARPSDDQTASLSSRAVGSPTITPTVGIDRVKRVGSEAFLDLHVEYFPKLSDTLPTQVPPKPIDPKQFDPERAIDPTDMEQEFAVPPVALFGETE